MQRRGSAGPRRRRPEPDAAKAPCKCQRGDKCGTLRRTRGPLHPAPSLFAPDEFKTSGAKAERSTSGQTRLRSLFPAPELDDLDVVWFHLSPWMAWSRRREKLWNKVDSGRHRSGFQSRDANYVGALGEALYHEITGLALRETCDPAGIKGGDFSDGTDVKTTRRWWNPWLMFPRVQAEEKVHPSHYGLVALNIEDADDPIAALLWRVTHADVLTAAAWWAEQDSEEYVYPFRKRGSNVPQLCVNWRSFTVGGISGEQLNPMPAPAPRKPPPPPVQERGYATHEEKQGYLAEMRRLLE